MTASNSLLQTIEVLHSRKNLRRHLAKVGGWDFSVSATRISFAFIGVCTHVTKGTLHASVFEDRLRQEHGASLIITSPTVPYKIIHKDGREEIISNPALFPSGDHDFKQIERLEPYVLATITVPEEYLGKVIELCEVCRPFPWQGLLCILNDRPNRAIEAHRLKSLSGLQVRSF
jgi:translation elongation factor EF-4